MGLFQATLLLFRTHFRRLAFSRRSLFCLLIAFVPAVLVTIILNNATNPPPPVDAVGFPGWFLLLGIVVPIVSLISGSSVFSEEVDDRTITYVFTRPIPRPAVLLGRWLATALVISVLCGLGASALVYACSLHVTAEHDPITRAVAQPLILMATAGGAVYTALFAAIGTFLKRPMIVGLAYTFVIEGFLANLPGKSQGLTIQYYLRSYIAAQDAPVWERIVEQTRATYETESGALWTLVITMAAALALGSWIVSRRQYVLTS